MEFFFFFQAKDGIRDCLLARGLRDVYKRQELNRLGINATIRREQGADIDAACGQLRAKERKVETR